MEGNKVVKFENVKELITLEIQKAVEPKLKENNVFPLIVIGRQFLENSDEIRLSILFNPNLDTQQKRVQILRDILEFEEEKLNNLN